MRAPTATGDLVVELRRTTEPDAPGLVLMHPGALRAEAYRPLLAALPPACSVWLVDLDRLPEYAEAALRCGPPSISLAEMGTRVAAALPEQPGDWIMAGWSFGGVVGFDTLRALPEERRPRRLVVMDSLAPVPEFVSDDLRDDMLLGWFAMYLAAKRGRPMPVVDDQFAGLDAETGLTDLLRIGLCTGALRPGTTLAGLGAVYAAYRNGLLRNNHLTAGYSARRSAVPVDVVRPESGLVRKPGSLGWAQVADVDVHPCAGDHYTMLGHPATVPLLARMCAPAAVTC